MKRYAIWFNGNNWEERQFMEASDAGDFIGTFESTDATNQFLWFITDAAGRLILIDKGVVVL